MCSYCQTLRSCYCWYVGLFLLHHHSFTQIQYLSHPYLLTVKMEKPQGCADPLATDSEFGVSVAQTPESCQRASEKRQPQERSHPELQDTQKVLEGPHKMSPVKVFNADPLSSAASVNTEQPSQPRPSQKAEHILKLSGSKPGPAHHSASQALSRIAIGRC